jgi:hypothetical protein
MLKQIHQRQVANLVPLIGEDAATATVRVNNAAAAAWVSFALIALPCGLWAELGGTGFAWIPAAAGAAVGLIALVFAVVLDRRSARMASEHVSVRLGHPVHLQAQGWRQSRWVKAIEKERARDDSAASGA